MKNETTTLEVHAQQMIEQYNREIDGLTRPLCKAAAGFTKRQAADLKAGYADGVASMLKVAKVVVAS